jgi:hypothetical protein
MVGSAGIVAAAIVASSALASTGDDTVDLGRGAYITSPDGTRWLVTSTDDGRLVESRADQGSSSPTGSPTSSSSPTSSTTTTTSSPTSTTPPANPVGLVVTSTGAKTASVSWNGAITGATYGRDGKDGSGYGAWTSPAEVKPPQPLTALVPGGTYRVTVAGTLAGAKVTQTVTFVAPGGPTGTPTGGSSSTPAGDSGASGGSAAPTGGSTQPTGGPASSGGPTSSSPTVTAAPGGSGGFPAAPTTGADAGWLSGSSGPFTANGQHAAWRGTPETIARTWVSDDQPDATLKPGAEYGSWRGSMDIGLPGVSDPSQWVGCSTGACDARWTTELTKLKAAWTSTDRGGGVLFISLAWEMNGNWFGHHVDPANVGAFTGSWKRFRALQQAIFPASKLVYNANRDTSGLAYDWRTAVPGWTDSPDHQQVSRYVDVMAVDYYDSWGTSSTTQAQFDSTAKLVDGYGAPVGIEAHRAFAQSVGLPLAVPEWSGVASGDGSTGDAASFPTAMHAFFAAHAGTGPGQVVYEVNYADSSAGNGIFVYYSASQMPKASAAYQAAF